MTLKVVERDNEEQYHGIRKLILNVTTYTDIKCDNLKPLLQQNWTWTSQICEMFAQ
jgi:hypothetical protein